MKKSLIILGLLITLPAFAGGVGYINYEKGLNDLTTSIDNFAYFYLY